MPPGVRGRLVTASFARDVLPTLPGAEAVPTSISRSLEAWFLRTDAALGPAASLRSVTDIAVVPLLQILGYSVTRRADTGSVCSLRVGEDGRERLAALVLPWGEPLASAWRTAVLDAVAADARWVLCCNGSTLRIVDGRRTWSRDFLELDLALLADDRGTQTMLWSLARAAAMAATPPLLDTAVDLSARHGVDVCRSLGTGVLESLEILLGTLRPAEPMTGRRTALPGGGAREHPPGHGVFEQSLTVLYRVLFLLFVEARGLVPVWHPVYRDRYSLEAIVAALLSGGRYRGLWQAIQAISRLAHAGCSTSGLRVTAFNGRLFAPAHVPAFDRTPIDDGVMARVVLAVSSTPVDRHGARARILYRDLDVEQLGAVYERVLEYEPHRAGPPEGGPHTSTGPNQPRRGGHTLTRTRDARKSSGTFYTPRAVTAALVHRTLEPLVRARTSDEILSLRIVDPAMGSGAFLVGACRFLAAAAEQAMVREGRWHPHDVTQADRIDLRRVIAGRCLFGADLNPMAVQLARLSLWLVTLAADKPLTFLDHHLVSGDSLVGASPSDLERQPSRTAQRQRRPTPVTLFETEGLRSVLENAVRSRATLTHRDDTVAAIRGKERTLSTLDARDGSLGRWRRALDLWCAGWFLGGPALDRGTFRELVQHALQGHSSLPRRDADLLLERADAVAAERRFLHWELTFPEVFVGDDGHRRPDAGFDAVLGNPPWDMVRGDSGDEGARAGRRVHARMMTDFVRGAGVYRVETRAHINRYQLFIERALQLARPGGRIGLVLPSGFVSDVGTAPLRRYLFDQANVDAITGLDNRHGIFPIHRSVRFVLLTCQTGAPTAVTRCRFGLSRTEDLAHDGDPLLLSRAFLVRLSGEDDLGIPELTSALDLRIVERIAAQVPRLGSEGGWNAAFGRELNATDDRDAFVPATGRPDARPVVEGKHIEPFRVALDRCTLALSPTAESRLRVVRRPRLAYRDVASATNRLTLIAAIIPPHAVTTHTLFCLRTAMPESQQLVLCALLNSFVANYLVRLRVNTHVTASLMSRLPVPFVSPGEPTFERITHLARAVQQHAGPVEDMPAYAELQAMAAMAYGLATDEFDHVLGTFPLIRSATRQAALADFTRLRLSRDPLRH
jgi:hypothetical protein